MNIEASGTSQGCSVFGLACQTFLYNHLEPRKTKIKHSGRVTAMKVNNIFENWINNWLPFYRLNWMPYLFTKTS